MGRWGRKVAVALRLLLKKGVKDAKSEAVPAPEPMGRGMGCEDSGAGPAEPAGLSVRSARRRLSCSPWAFQLTAVLSGWLRWKPVPVNHGPEETAGDGREPRGGNRRTRSPGSAPADPAGAAASLRPRRLRPEPLSVPLHPLWFGESLR